MDVRTLSTFSVAARTLSFTNAAATLGCAQSSVTAQMKSLEEDLGSPLFNRVGNRLELTEPGQTVVKHDVTIAAPLNLPATMPEHASELYSKNITALLELLIKGGKLDPDFDDEVVAAACVTRPGEDS